MARFILGALTFFLPPQLRLARTRQACPLWTRSEVFPVEVSAFPLHLCADAVRFGGRWRQAHNHTFKTFSPENLLSVDQRGFKTLIQAEGAEFLAEDQVRLNATVSAIFTSNEGVLVVLSDGTTLSADHALCTFSLGVLQHDDVRFIPPLPTWKQEAIHSMAMVSKSGLLRAVSRVIKHGMDAKQGTYTKIFLQFPERFWFDTEVRLSYNSFVP